MKLAYTSIFDPDDVHAWSGLGTYILSSLRLSGLKVDTIGSLSYKPDFTYKVKEILYKKVLFRNYRMLWDPKLLKSFAAQVDRAVAFSNPDVIFSVWSNPIAYLHTEKPIAFWGDSTLAALIESYPGYRNLAAETIRDGHRAEQLALSNCRLAVYSSEWAAGTAIKNYDVDPVKVKVVPFGANISCNRTIQDIRMNLAAKKFDACRLLFVGVDWARKGGDIALKVATRLNHRGIPTELHIVGCEPPKDAPDFVKRHGFISKSTDEGRRRLDALFSQAHFFILPTQAEAFGVVFCEASSFGVPSLATRVGGVPTAIREGVNGYTFPLGDSSEEYSDTIERLWSSPADYERLALSSFAEYSERLNWDVAGRKVRALIEEYCR